MLYADHRKNFYWNKNKAKEFAKNLENEGKEVAITSSADALNKGKCNYTVIWND